MNLEQIFIKQVSNIEIIWRKNNFPDSFLFFTHYIDPNIFYLFTKRLDGNEGWGQNLMVQIKYPNEEIQDIYIGSSNENIKKTVIFAKYPIIFKLKNNIFIKEPLINDTISYLFINYSNLNDKTIKKILMELNNNGVKIILDEHLLLLEYNHINNNNIKFDKEYDLLNIYSKFENIQKTLYFNKTFFF